MKNLHAAMKLRFARSALRSLRDMRLRIGLDPLAVSADDVDKLAREWEALADMQEINARRAIGIDALMFRIGVLGR